MISGFFQAEDGIRDLVRSRGLGDVYKRQHRHCGDKLAGADAGQPAALLLLVGRVADVRHADAVSYTHLTLPTSDLV